MPRRATRTSRGPVPDGAVEGVDPADQAQGPTVSPNSLRFGLGRNSGCIRGVVGLMSSYGKLVFPSHPHANACLHDMKPFLLYYFVFLGFSEACSSALFAEEPAILQVDPPRIVLSGPRAVSTLLVHREIPGKPTQDRTRLVQYRSGEPKIVQVNEAGVLRAVADGETIVEVNDGPLKTQVQVRVEGSSAPQAFHFENDILPILSRYSCNASGCHGKAEGQNGFKLSVFGFDPEADMAALIKEGRGRRIFPASPEGSLLLAKASGKVPHGGGVRIPAGSPDYETLRAWIAAGAPTGDPKVPGVAEVRVEPRERILSSAGQQQLRVVARYADGRQVDVTGHARFQSNNEALATVTPNGLVKASDVPGEAAILVAYSNKVDVFRVQVPSQGTVAAFPIPNPSHTIDYLVASRLKKLNIAPSTLCDDAEFLRRVSLDLVGTLPSVEEARGFLRDTRPDRRARLIDRLLERPEYADTWALKWADVLRIDRQSLGHRRAYAFYRWVRENLARNTPFDEFVQELLMAEGPLDEVGPANFYKVVSKPGEAASTLSQVFLGVRIGCAECHHHPYDRWGQDDYYGMQAFFTPLTIKNSPGGEFLVTGTAPVTKHPRTGAVIPPHALGAEAVSSSADPWERRHNLARWWTAPDNPWFARNLANRLWAHLMGRGLVEPVDDVRATNPPTNPALLDALAAHLVRERFDVKSLIRLITNSETYQRSSRPNTSNQSDELNASRALLRRIDAEVLLDMISQVTGVPEKFPAVPSGTRALHLWDSKVNHPFLKLFGRPVRSSACECERVREPGVAQVLHMLNSPGLHARLTHEAGTVAALVRRFESDAQLVEELYLTIVTRYPTEKERQTAMAHLKRDPKQRREAAEDLTWTLLNTLEFLFNH